MMEGMPGVQAHKADFAQLSLADQLQLVATDTDILVGEYIPYLLEQACWSRQTLFSMCEKWIPGML